MGEGCSRKPEIKNGPESPSVEFQQACGSALCCSRLTTHPERTVAAFKRFMGSDKRFELGEHRFTPEELSALVLGVVALILALLGMVLPWLAVPLLVLAMGAWIAGFLVLYYALARAAWQRLFTDVAPAPAGEFAA